MSDAVDQHNGRTGFASRLLGSVGGALLRGTSALLFGVRLWLAVCLALYVAFWLELDNAFWAGTSAALVCQPRLGASLRKAWFRMIGTVVGAAAIVLLTAAFPQDRLAFLVGLTLWVALSAFAATQLRNFAAYAAALAGYTAAIIAGDQLGATGGPDGNAFMLAVTRVAEIGIGIVSAGIVLAGTDLGAAPRRLAELLGKLAADIENGLMAALRPGPPSFLETQELRRDLIRRVTALDPAIDEAVGESWKLRQHWPVLQGAVDGLMVALAAWRTVSVRLASLGRDAALHETGRIMQRLSVSPMRRLMETPAATPSARLLADQTARALAGLGQARNAIAKLAGDRSRRPLPGAALGWPRPDPLPALVEAMRAFAAVGAMAVFWIVSEWPSGALAMTWTAIASALFAARPDEGYGLAVSFTLGNFLAAVGAAIVTFGVLPNVETFEGFALVLALYLVPVGTLMVQSWQSAMFAPMAGNFLPLLSPTNRMTYDIAQFYNSALAIIVGCGVAAIAFRLLPPLSPKLRIGRLMSSTLRDLRRLAIEHPLPWSRREWERRMQSRRSAMPDAAHPTERSQLGAALSVGLSIFRLRRLTPGLRLETELGVALQAFAHGSAAIAIACFERLDLRLAACGTCDAALALDARSQILVITDALNEYAAFFEIGS